MFFSPQQISDLALALTRRVSFYVASTMGVEFLTDEDKMYLEGLGVELDKLYEMHKDPLFLQYQLGMLSQTLKKKDVDKMSFSDLVKMVRKGQYIPLTEREQYTLESLKRQSLSSIKSLNGKIFADVNNIVSDVERNNREAYERVIREELERGVLERKSRKEVAQELGRRTGDWARNWNRIVQTESHSAFTEGRVAIAERKYGSDVKIYMQVYAGACKHCIRLYLTNGIGSKPKIFKLSELKDNGTNQGRKVDDWLPVLPPSHPHCRCHIMYLEGGEEWDAEKQMFVVPKDKEYESKSKRRKIKIMVGSDEYEV